jgi:hypothetical protein
VQVTKSKKHHTWRLTSKPASQPLTDTQKAQLSVTYSSFFRVETTIFVFFQKKSISGDDSRWMMMSVMMSRELKIVHLTTDRWMNNISQNIV